jgi:hypothetical protein
MKPFAVAAVSVAALMLAAASAPAQAHGRTSLSLHFGVPITGDAVFYGSTFHGGGLYYGGSRYWHRGYGPGFYGPPWGFVTPPPLYYMPPTVIAVPTHPPVYIERGPAPAQQAQQAPQAQPPQSAQQNTHWYYCMEAGAYYPYVRECPGRWHPVPAQPTR